VMTFDENVRDYLPARNRVGHLRQLMLALEKASAGTATSLVSPLKRVVEITRRRAMMVLISDLLAPLDGLEASLAALRACGHEVVVFQVLDPTELDFPFAKASLFHDVESGRDLYIDPVLARKEYLRKFTAHNAAIDSACRKLGITIMRLATNQPLELALFDFLRSRMQRGKTTRRAANRT